MSTPTPMDEAITSLIARIEKRRRLGRQIARAWAIIKPVVEAAPVDADGRHILTHAQVEALSGLLSKPAHPKSHRYDQDRHLNDILAELQARRLLVSPFKNVPVQLPREVLLDLDEVDPALIERVQYLATALRSRRMLQPPADWPTADAALWHFCVFVASLVLETGVFFPQLLGVLLDLHNADLVPAGSIGLPRRRRRDGRRPAEAEIFRQLAPGTRRALERLRAALTPGRQAGAPRKKADVFPSTWRSARWMRHVFPPHWRAFLLACGLPPDALGRQRPIAQLVLYGSVAALLRGIPPFVMDAARGALLTRPMTLASYRRLLLGKTPSLITDPATAPGPLRPQRIPARTRATAPGLELFDAIERERTLLRQIPDTIADRRAAIDRLTTLIGSEPFRLIPGVLTQEDTFTINAKMFGAFCCYLLRGKSKLGSILTRTSAIANVAPDAFGTQPLWAWTADHYQNVLSQGMRDHDTSSLIAAFKLFVACLDEAGIPTPDINWYARGLRKPLVVTPAPLVGFADFDHALDLCTEAPFLPDHLRELLQVLLILGFWAGLRVREATRLTLRQYVPSPYHVIEVRRSKTHASTRDLYLKYLVPPAYLARLDAFYAKRYLATGGALDAPYLGTGRQMASEGTNPHGFYDPSHLSSLAGLVLRCVIGEPIAFHSLRHARVSWLLLQLLATTKLITVTPDTPPWAAATAFSEGAYARLRPLLFGLGPLKPGQLECSHLLMVLSRLIGHADPRTTLETYCHTLELAHALLEDHLKGRG